MTDDEALTWERRLKASMAEWLKLRRLSKNMERRETMIAQDLRSDIDRIEVIVTERDRLPDEYLNRPRQVEISAGVWAVGKNGNRLLLEETTSQKQIQRLADEFSATGIEVRLHRR